VIQLARSVRDHRLSYLFVLPAFAFALVFSYYPAFLGLAYAFTNWQPGLSEIEFTGFENFRLMLADRFLYAGTINLAILLVATIGKYLTVPFVVAELVYHVRPRALQYWLRTLFVTPLVVPSMATILLWGQIYHPNTGLINNLLRSIGLGQLALPWLGNERTALAAIIFIGFPWVVVLPFLVYLGGLMNLPGEILDAARVDGAGRLSRLRHVILPHLRPTISMVVTLQLISTLRIFSQVYVMTNGGPASSSSSPIQYISNLAIVRNLFGYSAAIAMLLFALILLITLVQRLIVREAAR